MSLGPYAEDEASEMKLHDLCWYESWSYSESVVLVSFP